jgi:hypothetical protein
MDTPSFSYEQDNVVVVEYTNLEMYAFLQLSRNPLGLGRNVVNVRWCVSFFSKTPISNVFHSNNYSSYI